LAYSRYIRLFLYFVFVGGLSCAPTWASDGTVIKLPRRSELTPVQRLNREGVEAVRKHDYQRAEALFYKAYLYDPADPFTLNNLGYMSELSGNLDRAQKFYQLAKEQGSNASIDLTNSKHLEGKPMKQALIDLKDVPMRVNQTNIAAMRLLSQNRGFEAIAMLKQILPLDPRNAFTLNNLGVASEATGDLDGALRYYLAAASQNSSEPAAIALNQSWRGRSVSEMAAASARRLERRIRSNGSVDDRAVMLTIRGVFEANQNNWPAARQDFLQAYSLDPGSAFTLNNRGYVAEKDGDLETAQYFYGKAQRADNSAARVGFATQLTAEGQDLDDVASNSNNKVDNSLEIYSQERRREKGPVELTPRGAGAAAPAPPQPKKNQSPPQAEPAPQQHF
jgi:tetratricopeptide (TPR) repeat protein